MLMDPEKENTHIGDMHTPQISAQVQLNIENLSWPPTTLTLINFRVMDTNVMFKDIPSFSRKEKH
jgi:hypothetical protein